MSRVRAYLISLKDGRQVFAGLLREDDVFLGKLHLSNAIVSPRHLLVGVRDKINDSRIKPGSPRQSPRLLIVL